MSNFSVLLAVYERDDPILLYKAMSSVLANSIQPEEVVLVADGELTSDLLKIIHEISCRTIKLRLIKLPCNVGLAKALNVGLSSITTKYTIRADADDFNYPNRFQLLIEKLEEGFDLVGSAIREVDKTGSTVAYRFCPLKDFDIKKFVKRRNPFNHMTVGFRTSAVVNAGGYPNIHLKEDYALWATLLARGCKVCNLDMILVDATAGTEMFRRRGGLKYAIAEFNLQSHLVRCGLKSVVSAFFDGIMRSAIFLAPNFFREYVYLKFLRVNQ